MPVDVRVNVEELRAQLDVGDVLEPQDLAVGIGSQNDVGILLGLVIAPDIGQHVFARLRRHARGLAESPGRTDDALLGERLHDVFGGHPVGPHAVGLQPDAHRVGAVAEIPGATHALDALDHGHDVDVGEVVEKFLVGVGVRAVKVHIHQHAGDDLADQDPLPLHQGREPVHHDVDPVLHVDDVDVGSVPGSKKMRIVASPALVASETMYRMFCTPLIDCSSGISTESTRTLALAPG